MTGFSAARIRPAAVVLLVFVGVGVVSLLQQLQGWWQAAVIAPVVVLAALRLLPMPSVLRWAGIIVGAFIYPILALVGFARLWAELGLGRPDVWVSFTLGAVLLAVAVYVYVRPWWLREPSPHPRRWVAVVVVLLVLAPPVAFWLVGVLNGDEKPLGPKVVAVSRLDVVTLRPGTDPQDVESSTVAGWRIRSWTGAVGPGGVAWSASGAPPFVPANDVDNVLLLMPGAGTTEGEERTWLELADQVSPPTTPVFAVLETGDEAVLKRWRDAIHGKGGRVRRRGDARSLDSFGAARPGTTDIALKLAALSPAGDQDLALAAKHRPALFFDRGEDDHTPLNVDNLIASGHMSLCERGQALRSLCSAVHESADIQNGATNLAFDPDEIAKETRDTTIYVNVTHAGNDHPNTVYLDYWWYLAHNPTGAAGGALCGPGFVIAGITCLDHQSDWEGVTVVLDEDATPPAVTAVSYGQHEDVVRYSWDALQESWDRHRPGAESLREKFGEGIDTRERPLVFSARGTHASYPVACTRDRCQAGGVLGLTLDRFSVENRHGGERAWRGNLEARCHAICLTALPTREEGTRPARWNAFEGHWGTSTCVFGRICSSADPPRSPGFQGRFEEPWCFDWVFAVSNGRPTRHRGPRCTPYQEPDKALSSGERLLALGDSYSSGQGAGSYEPGTSGGGNTCYRSALAWPEQLALRRDLRTLQSLACSGARMSHLTRDRAKGEKERRTSQVGRIPTDPARRPDVITVTIGGNDAGFVKVLETCIAVNCVKEYHRPSGDLLERAVLAVGRQLPDVYAAIRRAAPDAQLVVVGYPRLFPEDKPGGAAANCAAWDRISAAEARYLNDGTRLLNAQIAATAAAAGADFVDVTDAFDGKELRCTGETYVNRVRLQSHLRPASFHPNAAGHDRLAAVVDQALDAPSTRTESR